MLDIITAAVKKGAKIYPNVSGGKDGQAMVKALANYGFKIQALLHCDLGRIEWPESLAMCQRQAEEFGLDLFVIKRKDGRGMIEHWRHRMEQLKGQNKPFWSSSAARYCTSDLKRDPVDLFYRNCGQDLIISCEGIRAGESKGRAKKEPLQVRSRCSHSIYKGMTAAEALVAYIPGFRLALTWYPIFNFSVEDVFATYGNTLEDLAAARRLYKATGQVSASWMFHPAYAYGNDRVSCMFCVLGSCGDLSNAAVKAPDILQELISMEEESGYTFRDGFSLKALL